MIDRSGLCLAIALAAAPPAAEAQTLRERLRALDAPTVASPYAEDRAADLDRIAREAAVLFDAHEDHPRAAIAFFTGPDCAECAAAQGELERLGASLKITIRVFDTGTPTDAALHRRLAFDTVPAYVMPDRLIRGHMPDFVLERYLRDAGS